MTTAITTTSLLEEHCRQVEINAANRFVLPITIPTSQKSKPRKQEDPEGIKLFQNMIDSGNFDRGIALSISSVESKNVETFLETLRSYMMQGESKHALEAIAFCNVLALFEPRFFGGRTEGIRRSDYLEHSLYLRMPRMASSEYEDVLQCLSALAGYVPRKKLSYFARTVQSAIQTNYHLGVPFAKGLIGPFRTLPIGGCMEYITLAIELLHPIGAEKGAGFENAIAFITRSTQASNLHYARICEKYVGRKKV